MDKTGSSELLNSEINNYSKIVSLDSLNSDSKSSSLNSKHGQESVRFFNITFIFIKNRTLPLNITKKLIIIHCVVIRTLKINSNIG